jgi:hypothetical protein
LKKNAHLLPRELELATIERGSFTGSFPATSWIFDYPHPLDKTTWQLMQDVLAKAGVLETAVSVTVEAISKYNRRFPLNELDDVLLAYNVADAPLAHGNGAPVRLVVPQQRGYDWVKWISHIQVNTTSAHLQSPLPLR